MSRQNKVNPGMYTQRGRLTQDDAARELRKQSAFGSQHAWQPVNVMMRPPLAPAGDAARDTEKSADVETMVEAPPQAERRPALRVTKKTAATKAALPNAKAKTAKAKTAGTRKSKRTTGKAKTVKAKTSKAKASKTTAMKRKATRPTTKRRKG